jgi:hypothetical protein
MPNTNATAHESFTPRQTCGVRHMQDTIEKSPRSRYQLEIRT